MPISIHAHLFDIMAVDDKIRALIAAWLPPGRSLGAASPTSVVSQRPALRSTAQVIGAAALMKCSARIRKDADGMSSVPSGQINHLGINNGVKERYRSTAFIDFGCSR